MNITTQISHQCAVTCPLNVLSASIHSKQRKIQQSPQCVPSNTAICSWWGGWSLSLSHIFVVRSNAETAVAISTATRYTDIPLSTSTAVLTYTSVFNPLLRSPAQTHVHTLTAFHFYIYSCHFWWFTLFKPGNSLSPYHSFLYLESQYAC
jgi:hypothetical protein